MTGYLKRKTDFATYKAVEIVSSEIVLYSSSGAQSKATIPVEMDISLEDYIVIDGWVGVISKSNPSKGQTDITIDDVVSLFGRELIFSGEWNSCEQFIVDTITNQFIQESDEMYRFPYITVTSTTSTEFVEPETKDNIYTLKSYIEQVRRVSNVFVDITADNTNINIVVEQREQPSHKIIFGEMGYQLSKENYSADTVAKVTALQGNNTTDYYLMADGEITTSPEGDRVYGKWKILKVSDRDNVADKVKDLIEKNKFTHSIEFFATKKLALFDTVYLKLHNSVLESQISQCTIRQGDGRYYYKSGDLKTTLTEKLRGIT